MAPATCPSGHQSTTTDYCDQCGAPIAGASPAAASPVDPPASTLSCPNCQSPSTPDQKFCEVCGYDFVGGTLPVAPSPVPVGEPVPVLAGPPWTAVVTADRAYHDKVGAADVPFPDHCPPRTFTLSGAEILIGRRSESRGIHPQIDLSGAPEDTGISRSQAILRRDSDGTWTVVDPGSTNGILLNDAADPLPPNQPAALSDGDRLYMGAWTKVEVHSPPR